VKTSRKIRNFIEFELLDGAAADDPLADGLLDSLAVEQLAAFLEDAYGVHLDDDDFVAENFASIDAVAALVDRKRAARR
jgi:acyl carrier protein